VNRAQRLSVVESAIGYIIPRAVQACPKITTQELLASLAKKTRFSAEEIVGRSRNARLVSIRHGFFYLCLAITSSSASMVGARYGFNHATVLNGAAKHALLHNLEPVTGYDVLKKIRVARNRRLAKIATLRAAE
jgi:chromosomal replication initiation ATPase DnaA